MYSAPWRTPSRIPFGPSVTCSISFGPGRQVATISDAAATAAGESTQVAPRARSDAAASRRMSWTSGGWPAGRSCPAIGLPMLPTPMNPTFMAWGALRGPPCSQRGELDHVVPQDLLLAGAAERERQESVHGLRILGVAVRGVGGGDEVGVTEGVDDVLHELLVALHRAVALATEVLGRRHGEMGHLAVRLAPLVVLVHAMQPEGQPAALRFQEGEPQAREALHHAAHDDVHAGQHLLDRVR